MARRRDDERLETIVAAIKENPNRKPGWLARRLGYDNKTMMRALYQLEDSGELLAEDERGRLSWLKRRQF